MNSLVPSDQDAEPSLPVLPKVFLPAIADLVKCLGIPRDVLASDEEIEYAWRDLPRELRSLPPSVEKGNMARMCVAISTGLFDSAVNYIWNAAVLQLREKVRIFGLPVVAQIRRSDFEEKQLLELQDSELLDLAHQLNILGDDGFFFLDQCRNIRNSFSAAHPTLGPINDRELITFLNRCTKYALADASSPRGVNIGDFISALKGARFSGYQLRIWVERLQATHAAQRQLLIVTAYGIYCDPSSPEPARLNAIDLCSVLKAGFTADTRSDLINSHTDYVAKGDEGRRIASSQFLEKLGLLNILDESERHNIIAHACEGLWTVHSGFNNFYNEPPFAQRLLELSRSYEIPETAQQQFVRTVIGCYMGDGYGASWSAEPAYASMIQEFSPREISLAVQLAGEDDIIARKIKENPSCRSRYIQALGLIDTASLPVGAKADYENLLHQLRGDY